MKSFKQDYAAGIQSENALLPILNKYFNTTFTKTSQYHPVDFQSPKAFVELKTRTNRYSQYPTTMLPYSKITFAKQADRPTYFVFAFTDNTYFIEYNQSLFSTFTTNEFQRQDRQDHTDRNQDYIYIPIKHLLRLSTNEPVAQIPQEVQRGKADVVYSA